MKQEAPEHTNGVSDKEEAVTEVEHNGVAESNGDGEPAAKRPKHETTNGEAEERSRDHTSPENRADKTEPKKEVSLCEIVSWLSVLNRFFLTASKTLP